MIPRIRADSPCWRDPGERGCIGAMTIRVNDVTDPHEDLASRLNWLRAGVLGASDGIVSVAAVVVGVAGVTSQAGPILVAGLAAVLGGAISIALGEYVSVSSQTDSQRALGVDEEEVVSPWHAALARSEERRGVEGGKRGAGAE